MSTPWDVSTASYNNVFKDVSGEDTPRGVFFKPDGSKMYIAGDTNNAIFQYSLSTAWSVSSASYDTKFADVSGEGTDVESVFFKPDGSKMYVVVNNTTVCQYGLSTAWDVSTASYDNKSKDVSNEETGTQSVFFSPNGNIMYIAGSGTDAAYQYALSSAWDVSTASYDNKSCDASNEDTNVQGMFLSADGTKMYIAGYTNSKVFQYTLSTPWDLSSGSYASKFKDISSEEGNLRGVAFKSDGSKMYILGHANDTVFQYSLPSATSSWRDLHQILASTQSGSMLNDKGHIF